MEIFNSPLRPGLSYPVKPSRLSALLEESGVQTPSTLYKRCETWWTDGVLFRADFYPPWRYHKNEGEILHFMCRSVPSIERLAALRYLEEDVFPAMLTWVMQLESLPLNSPVRREKQSFARIWNGLSPPA
jgi:hypothetical protein